MARQESARDCVNERSRIAMKFIFAVVYTDNKTARIETDEGNFYLTDDRTVYDMHPLNHMAKTVPPPKQKEVIAAIKAAKYKAAMVKEWL